MFGLSGCWFKRKPPVPQPQAQAPTTPETPAPPQEQPPATEPQPEQKPADTTQTAETKPKPKPKPKNHTAHKQAPPAPKPEEKPQQQAALKPPPKIIIQEGGANDTGAPISTAMGHDEATHRRLSTAQLIDSTESNLRGLTRPLTADEQATVAQIKDYLEQSRAATKQQDLVRAHNLALKAHLLSDELVKK